MDVAVAAGGDIYVSDALTDEVLKFADDGTPLGVFANTADGLVVPLFMEFDLAGNLYVVNRGPSNAQQIVKIAPDGNSQVLAPVFPGAQGLALCQQQLVLQVDLDIKPGSNPNSINCEKASGIIPVAISSTPEFDATTVDHTGVTFEGASEIHEDKKSGDPRRHEEDVDKDGDTDLVFHFKVGDTTLTCISTEGTLTGQTFGGQVITGTDTVRMLEK